MPTLSGGDLTTLSKNMQKSKVYLSIFRPQSIAVGTIASIGSDKRDIEINFTDGDSADIEEGMTALIGSGFSTLRIGKIRVRSFDSENSILSVAENDLVFNIGDEINILKYWELWPVYHRVEVSGDDLTVYQDYDIEYDDQNDEQDPVVVMSSHCAKDMKNYASASIYWTAVDSWSPVGATIESYEWEFEGGSPSTYSGHTPGFVEYDAPGWFWSKVTVTDSNGKSFVGRRAVILHNNAGPPYTAFEIRSLSGGWDEFGWQSEIVLHEDVPYTYHWDNALAILWHDSWYNATKKEFGTQIDRGHILFTGWVEGDSLVRDPYSNNTTFQLSGAGPYLQRTLNFPVTLEHTNDTPDKWWLIENLTVDAAVRFFLRNSTTALTICNFTKSGQTLKTKYFDYGEDTVSSAINNATYDRGSFIRFGSDHYSNLFLSEEPQIHSGTIGYVMSMADQWWRDQITFSHAQRTNIAWAELSGVYFDGNEPAPMISMAPGESPLWDGSQTAVGGLICPDQKTLNIWAGRFLGWKNNPFPEATFPMAGNFAGVFDVIPPETVLVTLNGNDNKPGYTFNNRGFLIRGVEHTYDGYNLLTNLRCEMLTLGDPGIQGRYPDIPPPPPEECTPCDPCDPDYPCEPPPEPPPTGTTGGGWRPCWVCTHTKLYYVENIKAPPSTDQPDVYDASADQSWFGAFAVDPYDPENFQFMHAGKHFAGAKPLMYRSGYANPGSPWTRPWYELVPSDRWAIEMKKYGAGSGTVKKMVGLELDINKEGRIYISADVASGSHAWFFVLCVCFSKGAGGLLTLDSVEVIGDLINSPGQRYYHDVGAILGQADGIRIGDFNLLKDSAAWNAQPNKLYVGGGNLGATSFGAYKKVNYQNNYDGHPLKIFTGAYATITTEPDSDPIQNTENMRNRPVFVDPNCPDKIFTWFPGLNDTQFEIKDYAHSSTILYPEGTPCPPLLLTYENDQFQPGDIYGSHHHGISVTWHPEAGKHGQYIRFMDHYENKFTYSDDEGETFYQLNPLGHIGVNTSATENQKWIISLVQDEQDKLYMAKNGQASNVESDADGETIQGGQPRDNMFCIAVHDVDPTHSDTTIEFFDRSGVDDSGKGTERMEHPLGAFCIVPVWTIAGEE